MHTHGAAETVPPMGVEAVVFDLDGVLRIWDPAIVANAEQHNGLPAGSLAAVAFGDTALLQRAVTGVITDAQWRVEISDRLAADHGASAREAVAQWSLSAGRVDAEVLDLVRRERARRTVALFSNATTRLGTDLSRLGLGVEFDVVFNSSSIGMAKPSSESFEAVVADLGVSADRCLFIDDTPANIRAAGALGMSTHHFRGARALGRFLDAPEGHPR